MYHFDQTDGSLVIDGFEDGIAESPFKGISDLKNVNIITCPGEASVNFATSKISPPTISGSVTSTDAGTDKLTYTGTASLESGMAIVFSASTITNVATNVTYWVSAVGSPAGTFQLYSDYSASTLIDIQNNGTGTFTGYVVNQPKYFTHDIIHNTYWMVDALGQVWSNTKITTGNSFWTYTGNYGGNGQTHGNGIVFYQTSDLTKQYILVFRDSRIDYTLSNLANVGWTYGWNPSTGGTASNSDNLNTASGTANPHESLVGQDNVVYYTDSNFVGSFFEKAGQTFLPTNTATYTFALKALPLPGIDKALSLAELGTNLLVGGQRNLIYPWNRIDTSFTYPIWLAESVIVKMITVNTNTFIFVGNRGRIYVTNGSQAQLYKKIPDHISGTVEPYYVWGGVCSTKNQLYFSASVTNNASTAVSGYGGVWAIDMDTKAIRLTNKLSYGTYLGYATAMIAVIPSLSAANPSGVGIYIGWDDGASGYGIDTTTSSPYTGSQATIDSDLIPVGTFQRPKDFQQIEFKLSKPMVSGESVILNYRTDFSQTYASILSDSTVGDFSKSGPINFKNAQWLQLQAVLNSTASTPSFTRLKEIRIR